MTEPGTQACLLIDVLDDDTHDLVVDLLRQVGTRISAEIVACRVTLLDGYGRENL